MRVAAIVLVVSLILAAPSTTATGTTEQQQPVPASPAHQALNAGVSRIAARDPEGARGHFQRALELARAEGSELIEGAAHRGLGTALLHLHQYPLAKPEFDAAVAIFEKLDSKPNLAVTLIDLGAVEYHLGDFPSARETYLKALAIVRVGGSLRTQAMLHYNMSLVANPHDEQLYWIHEGLALARQAGSLQDEGNLLHSWSDHLFDRGQLAESMEKVELAIERLEGAADPSHIARALTSLGRLQRAHGQHAKALDSYRRAFEIQEKNDDRRGMMQSLNAMGVASGYLGRPRDERAFHERAVALAHRIGSPSKVGFIVGNLASALIRQGEAAKGVEMLEELVQSDAEPGALYAHLAAGYLALKRYDRAVASAERSIELALQYDSIDLHRGSLMLRAAAREKLGQTAEALADALEAVALVERTRAEAVPTDSMKLGFSGEHQAIFTRTIGLLQKLGRHREALDVAEKARGRAFADLLASRDAWATPSSDTAIPAELASGEATASREGLAVRGASQDRTPAASAPRSTRHANDLQSARSIPPLTSHELAGIASRLQSTIVSFWVAPEATHVWVVKGTGEVHSARIEVTNTRLSALVRRARSVRPGPEPTTERGAPDDPETAADTDESDTEWMPRLRGEGLLSLGTGAVAASRALHALLLEPIQSLLPAKPGSLLTIIPHGPLFQLSFAALQDASGRYLVERHAIHYAPAGVVLRLTEAQKRGSAATDPGYLLVADPASLPALPDGKPLSRLPGSQREVGRVAALLSGSRVTRLVGARATEEDVRRLAGTSSVIHLATHGVVRNDDPLESFLALDTGVVPGSVEHSRTRSAPSTREMGATRAAPGRDGRLTVREIYDLHLDADLVVLSACGTGLGRVSGDGVAGLARAFVYAGAPSVVATLWDLADEPAAQLMPQFYRSLQRQPDKAQALRNAQLSFLRDLRAGRVKVSTPAGAVTLPEHPVLWAGFVLVGER